MDAPAVAVSDAESPPAARPGAWRVGWLTPWRCRLIFALLLLYGFLSHLSYVRNPNCPLDLSGDEAHYWDWSRNLDLSYYSKGPLVACLIRASCAIFGDTMWAVRLPALVLGVATSLVTYSLTLKLFRSDRLALGAMVLNHIVPMFVAGSLLMTIDPPFFFCWALATYLLALVLFDGRRWLWPAVGVVVGVGFLAKYAMFLWLPTALLVLWLDGERGRRELRACRGWLIATAIALLFTTPVIVWNARHGWVSLMHVGKQTGTAGGGGLGGAPLRIIEFLAGQAAVVGPPLVVMMVAAGFYARRLRRNVPEGEETRRAGFLLWVALPFFVLATLVNLRAKAQLNWPAPAYFTLMILVAWYLSTRLRSPQTWRPWRPWFYPAVAFGLLMMPVAHNFELVYPLIGWADRTVTRPWFGKELSIRQLDPTVKLRGWEELGQYASKQLDTLRPGAFILCEDYQQTSELAFYAAGQPKTYYFGSYLRERTKRHSQYDLWLDRSLDPKDNPALLGKDAVYVGYPKPELTEAFERVEELPLFDIERRGAKIRTFRVSRCYGFKGMVRPESKKY
jgi:undecaprenyl-diphosphatase